MEGFKKVSRSATILPLLLSLAGVLGLATPFAQAATSPSLGAASTFSVLAQSAITDAGAASVISGDVGMNASGASITGLTAAQVAGTIFATDLVAPSEAIIAPAVQANALTAFGALNAGNNADANCIGGILPDGTDLRTLSPLSPGVYCSAGSFTLSNGVGDDLVLTGGAGTWVFKTVTGLTTAVGSTIVGGDACNTWWRVGTAATINGAAFEGTILAQTGVHFGAGAAMNGRALAIGADVTMIGNTLSGPICAAAAGGGGNPNPPAGTITVIKNVVNDNGRTSTAASFPLFVNGQAVVSGESNTFFPAAAYDVTETSNLSLYTRTFSGDCDVNGRLSLNAGQNKVCVITNDDIGAAVVVPPVPPLIDIVKVPSPLALPNGPGSVTYSYTVRNVGTVPMTNVTLIGDSCSPITRVSGDLNVDNILQVSETWNYTCTTSLSATHTNTVVATGLANGITATDVASATVVVGVPLIPPLIHVTKVPSPLTLLAGGGSVTYTEKITNPGTVPLNNVGIVDDKCSPMAFVSGDVNGDSKLDPSETWTYTCRTNLTQTTVNTARVSGEANGFTVRDFAVATVVVAQAVAVLPNTGTHPTQSPLLPLAASGALIVVAIAFAASRKKNARVK